MSQEQVQRTSQTEDDSVDPLPQAIETPEVADLLDEIDSVLEENAEQFVNDYRQKGGQ